MRWLHSGRLTPYYNSPAPLLSAADCPKYSASIGYTLSTSDDVANLFARCCEISEPVPSFLTGMPVVLSWGLRAERVLRCMIEMIHALNGDDEDLPGIGPTTLTGGYGERSDGYRKVRFRAK